MKDWVDLTLDEKRERVAKDFKPLIIPNEKVEDEEEIDWKQWRIDLAIDESRGR